MSILRLISVVSVVVMTIGLSVANAEDKSKPTTAQSSAQTQQTPQAQPAQTQTKMVTIEDAMQLTPAQRVARQTIMKQQTEHTRQMQVKYRELLVLSKAEKLDKDKINDVTNEMVSMVRKFAAESTAANHDFYSSLTPDQNKRLDAVVKQLQQRQQLQQQRQQQQQPIQKN